MIVALLLCIYCRSILKLADSNSSFMHHHANVLELMLLYWYSVGVMVNAAALGLYSGDSFPLLDLPSSTSNLRHRLLFSAISFDG